MTPVAEPILSPLSAILARSRRFANETWLREPPPLEFTTANRVVLETAAMRLRVFDGDGPAPAGDPGVPFLVVPPEVNRSTIVDFAPGQSLVQVIRQAGFPRVAVLEWRTACDATAGRDIDDSVADIHSAVERLGGRVHLLGVCQGGWESAVAAALRPETVETLTLVAAPLDFHAGDGVLKQLTRWMPMSAYRSLVASGRGRMLGSHISLGFDSLMPFERFVVKPLSVWNHVDDAGWLQRYHRLNDWYRAPKDLPGPLYLRAVRELFKENRLVQGRFLAHGQLVDLSRITCPLCLVAGARDHITPPEQLFDARPCFGSSRVREVLTHGGHIGTFMGRRELVEHWPGILTWLGRESSRGADHSSPETVTS